MEDYSFSNQLQNNLPMSVPIALLFYSRVNNLTAIRSKLFFLNTND